MSSPVLEHALKRIADAPNNSFHGAEPIAEAGVCRDLPLHDIQRLNPSKSKSIGPW